VLEIKYNLRSKYCLKRNEYIYVSLWNHLGPQRTHAHRRCYSAASCAIGYGNSRKHCNWDVINTTRWHLSPLRHFARRPHVCTGQRKFFSSLIWKVGHSLCITYTTWTQNGNSVMLYVLKLWRRQNSIKSSRATSRVETLTRLVAREDFIAWCCIKHRSRCYTSYSSYVLYIGTHICLQTLLLNETHASLFNTNERGR
jgi:hypothetical protein